MSEFIFSYSTEIVSHLGVINLIAAAVTVYDKKQARTHGRRIPEKSLFTPAILGGSSVVLVMMHIIHHKIQYKRLMLGLPFITLAQLIVAPLVYQSIR